MRCTAVALFLLIACGGGTEVDTSVESDGPHPVGVKRQVATYANGQTQMPYLLFYPAATTAAVAEVTMDVLEGDPHGGEYAALLAAAEAGCPTRSARVAVDAQPADGTFPLIAFSHCHECTRFSGASIARRLASHGFFVVAPDHVGNTLWNQLEGTGVPLGTEALEQRIVDIETAVGAVRGDASVSGSLDGRLGIVGHSFGSVTAGLYAQRNAAEVGAAFGLAAPMENPLLPGVNVADLAMPLGFLVAREDNSITELGNDLIRNNFAEAPGRAWKLEVADAGHWSVSDLVGVVPGFAAGCGDGVRQTDGQPFTYLPAETGRDIAASYVTAFFEATLLGDAGAEAYLATGRPSGTVTAEHK